MGSAKFLVPPVGVRFAAGEPPALAAGKVRRPRAALLLDRDGTLVREVNYLHRLKDLRLQAGAAALVRAANVARVAVATVSNQSGIDRGMFGWDEYDVIEAEIARRLGARGAHLDFRVANAFHPDFTPRWGATHARWRKPGPGMLLLALERLGISPARAWMVGDMASDALAAKAAGLAGSVHLLTGHGKAQRDDALAVARGGYPVQPARSLAEAWRLLVRQGLLVGRSG